MIVPGSHQLNVSILNTRLQKEAWLRTFWAKLAGFQDITRTNGIRQSSPADNVVVQMVKDFIEQGRDNMLGAMILPLKEPPVFGDTQLKGTGEDLSMRFIRIYINQVRKAVTSLSGRMSNQRVKVFKVMEQAKPALVEYWSKWFNAELFEVLYNGVSEQISRGTNDQGIGLKMRYHPHQFIADNASDASVTLPAIGTEGHLKTESDYQAADGLILGKMGANLISTMRMKLLSDPKLLLRRIVTEDGNEFWLWLVSPKQFKDMKYDSNIVRTQDAAFNATLRKHPAIAGRDMLYYDGFCFLEEVTGIRTMSTNSTTPRYQDFAGPGGWIMPPLTGSGRAYGGLILGADAIQLGIGSTLQYTEEVDDHKNTLEIGSNCIRGGNRCDFFDGPVEQEVYVRDNPTRSVFNESKPASNQSSAIVWTL